MLLMAVPEETYCLKTQHHQPVRMGSNLVCYRCGLLIGKAESQELGSLLDY
jgi:hypothetical protein